MEGCEFVGWMGMRHGPKKTRHILYKFGDNLELLLVLKCLFDDIDNDRSVKQKQLITTTCMLIHID